MNTQPIFSDPSGTRWKKIKAGLCASIFLTSLIFGFLLFHVTRVLEFPPLTLLPLGHDSIAVPASHPNQSLPPHPSDVHNEPHRPPFASPKSSYRRLQAAFYDENDPRSLLSLKDHIHQLNVLFPQWLHLDPSKGIVKVFPRNGEPYNADSRGIRSLDIQDTVKQTIEHAHADLDIVPVIDDIDHSMDAPDPATGRFLRNKTLQIRFVQQLDHILAANPMFKGLAIRFGGVSIDSPKEYSDFLKVLSITLHQRGLPLYVCLDENEVEDTSFLRLIAASSDSVVLMMFDQNKDALHPGPLADQRWFTFGLRKATAIVAPNKLICVIGNYGYDWKTPLFPDKRNKRSSDAVLYDLAVPDIWQEARQSHSQIRFDSRSLNPHFAFLDPISGLRHDLWWLDGTTALNQLRAAHALGIESVALYRLGFEERGIWSIWDDYLDPDAENNLRHLEPEPYVSGFGEGDILRFSTRSIPGERSLQATGTNDEIIDEKIHSFPHGYELERRGYDRNQLAITFDDGPDPEWTPRILDVLKSKKVPATFFVVGQQAQAYSDLVKQAVLAGHEIGNHTYSHPDMDKVSFARAVQEVNLTERLLQSKIGVTPHYYRPPKDIDQGLITKDEANAANLIQNMGYLIVGARVDSTDWDQAGPHAAQTIVANVVDQLHSMKEPGPKYRGSIILMHDGGGNRSATLAALPVLIDRLRTLGYHFVPLSELVGKTREEAMPSRSSNRIWSTVPDLMFFSLLSWSSRALKSIFLMGGILIAARLFCIGILAGIARFRPRPPSISEYKPRVTALIPAYNEERTIANTIHSVLSSDYPLLRIIVVDDGSTDRTHDVIQETFGTEIAAGTISVLAKENAGKAEALNFALQEISEEIYIGIDADSMVAPDAIRKLISHFSNPRIGAVAGNIVVGNEVNRLTLMQALEYVTGQSLERRAFGLFGMVTVIPGAFGAWRTEAVRKIGGYQADTVAEDADLTVQLIEQGYQTVYEDRAIAFTEAPIHAKALRKQRFRWTFGVLQTLFKHRLAFSARPSFGLFVLPSLLLYQVLFPLLSPLLDFVFLGGMIIALLSKPFQVNSASNAAQLILYFLIFAFLDAVTCLLALGMDGKTSAKHLSVLRHLPFQRFGYRYLLCFELLRSIKRAFDGRPFEWTKIERSATLTGITEPLSTPRLPDNSFRSRTCLPQ